MGALDHFLNGLNTLLKAGERADAEKAAEREARRAAKSRAAARVTSRSFNAAPTSPVAVPADPSCCLAKRRFDK